MLANAARLLANRGALARGGGEPIFAIMRKLLVAGVICALGACAHQSTADTYRYGQDTRPYTGIPSYLLAKTEPPACIVRPADTAPEVTPEQLHANEPPQQ